MQLHTSLHTQQAEKFALSTENKMGGPDPGREGRMTFKKRACTVIKKAHELAALSGANVYFIIDHPRATVVYNSVEDERRHWPPPDEFLVELFLRSMSGHFPADKAPGTPSSSPATNFPLNHGPATYGHRWGGI